MKFLMFTMEIFVHVSIFNNNKMKVHETKGNFLKLPDRVTPLKREIVIQSDDSFVSNWELLYCELQQLD